MKTGMNSMILIRSSSGSLSAQNTRLLSLTCTTTFHTMSTSPGKRVGTQVEERNSLAFRLGQGRKILAHSSFILGTTLLMLCSSKLRILIYQLSTLILWSTQFLIGTQSRWEEGTFHFSSSKWNFLTLAEVLLDKNSSEGLLSGSSWAIIWEFGIWL